MVSICVAYAISTEISLNGPFLFRFLYVNIFLFVHLRNPLGLTFYKTCFFCCFFLFFFKKRARALNRTSLTSGCCERFGMSHGKKLHASSIF